MTRLALMPCVLMLLSCGSNADSPSGITEAKIDANDSWRVVLSDREVAGGATVGQVLSAGSGRQCVTGRLMPARLPAPAGGPWLIVTVGSTRNITRSESAPITVCGSGSVEHGPTVPSDL